MTETIILGGGCFWCTEGIFQMVKGVTNVRSGYAGGNHPNPDYEMVTSGSTGHAEVIKVEYDPSIINLEKILQIFFEIHDPTSLNKQGNDIGTQYRSIILYKDEDHKEVINNAIKNLKYDKPVVTEVKKLDNFYPAEDYHSNYYIEHKIQPYCSIVITPKIKHFEEKFSEWVKSV